VIAAFEAANPEITIEATRYASNGTDLQTAITTAIAAGDPPETARLDIILTPQFASQGALMQLDGTLPNFDKIAADTFPGPLSTNKWNGHYYGLPLDTNTQVLIYSKDLFKAAGIAAAPTTMTDFVTARKAHTVMLKVAHISGHPPRSSMLWVVRLPMMPSLLLLATSMAQIVLLHSPC